MVKRSIGTFVVMILMIIFLTGCAKKASQFTEEEHIQRVTERIEKRFMTDSYEYTGFEVYPLYNENDELKYFLVEFEPYGFVYVLLRDEQLKLFGWLGASTSMYKLSGFDGNDTWSPFTYDESNSQPYPDIDKCWKTDENGEKIVYNRSPYCIADIENERRYLLHIEGSYIPSVKREERFLNLISLEEFEAIDGQLTKKQAYAFIIFVTKKQLDL